MYIALEDRPMTINVVVQVISSVLRHFSENKICCSKHNLSFVSKKWYMKISAPCKCSTQRLLQWLLSFSFSISEACRRHLLSLGCTARWKLFSHLHQSKQCIECTMLDLPFQPILSVSKHSELMCTKVAFVRSVHSVYYLSCRSDISHLQNPPGSKELLILTQLRVGLLFSACW